MRHSRGAEELNDHIFVIVRLRAGGSGRVVGYLLWIKEIHRLLTIQLCNCAQVTQMTRIPMLPFYIVDACCPVHLTANLSTMLHRNMAESVARR